jgi:hypothetical protein
VIATHILTFSLSTVANVLWVKRISVVVVIGCDYETCHSLEIDHRHIGLAVTLICPDASDCLPNF